MGAQPTPGSGQDRRPVHFDLAAANAASDDYAHALPLGPSGRRLSVEPDPGGPAIRPDRIQRTAMNGASRGESGRVGTGGLVVSGRTGLAGALADGRFLGRSPAYHIVGRRRSMLLGLSPFDARGGLAEDHNQRPMRQALG